MKPLTPKTHGAIVYGYNCGQSSRTIAKQLASTFSDESTFTQFQQGRQGRIWREPAEELNPDCVAVTVKHSPSKMFWGVFFLEWAWTNCSNKRFSHWSNPCQGYQ